MKKLIDFWRFFVAMGFFATYLPDVCNAEEYKQVASATIKWGSKDNEFAIPKWSEETGPKYITIYENHLYILDAVKRQLLVFDNQCRYEKTIKLEIPYIFETSEVEIEFKIDNKGNIFLLSRYWGFFVDKFDDTGKLLHRFIIGKGTEIQEAYYNKFKKEDITSSLVSTIGKGVLWEAHHIVTDSAGSVYLTAWKGKKTVIVNISGKIPESRVVDDTIPGLQNLLGNNFIENLYDSHNDTCEYNKINKNGVLVSKIKVALPGKKIEGKYNFFIEPIGEDKYNNCYFLIGEFFFKSEINNWVKKYQVNKFDEGGKMTARINLGIDNKAVIVDKEGNIFQVIWNGNEIDKGIQLNKWSAK